MPIHSQKGFTLVELMVAMAIGTVVILGAGQLFLTTFQTFKKVDELSRKQEAVVFAANHLVNQYRKSETGYALALTTNSSTDCSIIEIDNGPSSRPIIGGLALYKDECNTDRFVSSPAEGPDGEKLDGFHLFKLDFKRDDDEKPIESISFHVMERNFDERDGYVLLSGANITVSDSPNISGKVHAEGSLSGISRSSTVTSAAEGDATVMIPDASAFIAEVAASEQVQKECAINSMTSPVVYCAGGISGDFSIIDSDVQVVVASGSVAFSKSGTENASSNISIVAGGAVAVGQGGGWGDIDFNGLIWAGGNVAFNGDSSSAISGRIIAGETVDNISGVGSMRYQNVNDFFDAINAIDGVSTPSFP